MPDNESPSLDILGLRGIPAKHGGFETFAEHLALYLVGKGWKVRVYCQEQGEEKSYEDTWNGVQLVHIPVRQGGSIGTIIFDWLSICHSIRNPATKLTLGYNTAVFNIVTRLAGKTNLINMDGIEWRRGKWSRPVQAWFYVNERIGCLVGNHLVADHPEIENHLATRVDRTKITMIPYGADPVESARVEVLQQFGLPADGYAIIIARPEPENSILEIVQAFCRSPRQHKLVVLGTYRPEENSYHKKIQDTANPDVIFPGAIYEKETLNALRYFARVYIHGHQVGGTNPSLVEALAAGSPVLAHDNKYNRWVAGDGAEFFSSMEDCAEKLTALFGDDAKTTQMKQASRDQYQLRFTWETVLSRYEELLLKGVNGRL
ncbi:MAG: DUF1972 domain-containing protein [Nitrospina sp.]|nr:DUF1972 domain-containing protein [Nitrospina sp.]